MNKKPYTKINLPNGLTLVAKFIPWVQSVSVYIVVHAGPRYETKQASGLAHFLEHMLFEGTKKLTSSKEVAEYIEKIGGIRSAFTEKDYVLYSAKVPKKYAREAFDYLAEILFNSTLQKEAVEKEKRIVLQELKLSKDNPEVDIWESWMECVFGKDHPLGRSTLGDTSTIKTITREKLKTYRDNLYVPSNMVIAVIGNLQITQIKNYAMKYFGKIHSKITRPYFNKSFFRPKKTCIKLIKSDRLQNQLILGFVTGISYKHKDRFPMKLLSDVICSGINSRLFHKLVYELAIAYAVGAGNLFFSDTGLFYISGGFSSEHIDEALRAILAELSNLIEERISLKELEEVKQKNKAALVFSQETPDAIAYSYVVQEATEKKIMTIDEVFSEINKVSVNDIQNVARRYLTNKNACLMIKGPLDNVSWNSTQRLLNKYFLRLRVLTL
ncbi:insulinase family protein [Candidatus Roizmanbacteria bacterium]|nr:insulinase family protein [Candidatus Roizmanbacteria bacterium]